MFLNKFSTIQNVCIWYISPCMLYLSVCYCDMILQIHVYKMCFWSKFSGKSKRFHLMYKSAYVLNTTLMYLSVYNCDMILQIHEFLKRVPGKSKRFHLMYKSLHVIFKCLINIATWVVNEVRVVKAFKAQCFEGILRHKQRNSS